MKNRCESRYFTFGEGKHEVYACLSFMGNDAVLLIGGGQTPHAGCIIICEPDEANSKVTTSIHTFKTHREEVVARPIAEEICRLTRKKVVCICGIHVDNAKKKDIETLVKNTGKLGRMVLKELVV